MTELTSDASRDLLHAAGWSLGEYLCGATRCVDGTSGEDVLLAAGPAQAAAWRQAVGQARSLGVLGRRSGYPSEPESSQRRFP